MAPPSLLTTTKRERVTTVEKIKKELPTRDKTTLKKRIQNIHKTLQTPKKNVLCKKRKCWKAKEDNTSTMNAERDISQGKAAKDQTASKQTNKEIKDDAIIDNSMVQPKSMANNTTFAAE